MSTGSATAAESVPPASHTAMPPTVRASSRPSRLASWSWLRERGMGASILVSTISAAFGVLLLNVSGYIAAMLRADPYFSGSATMEVLLAILSGIFIGVAVYVASVVTANTFSTIVAGRTRHIALRRLVGASARSERAAIARQGLIVGVIGAILGLVLSVTVSLIGLWALQQARPVEGIDFSAFTPALIFPVAVVALTTWVAAWAGSRRVLTVTPLQAIGGAVDVSREDVAGRRRNRVALVLFIIGAVMLAGGVLIGLFTPLAIVVSFVGGVLSFTGVALGASLYMPTLLRLVGTLFGRSAAATLAVQNALRYPERSSRTAVGVVIGVTLVTMFACASNSITGILAGNAGGELPAEVETAVNSITAIVMGLVGISAVIAAVGLVNLLTIGVVQRRRELGLLRALGASRQQILRMMMLEAAHITITAVGTGLVLGIGYGWVAAQSLLGSVNPVPGGAHRVTVIVPSLPLGLAVGVVVVTAVLTLIASVTPARLATRVTPVQALAEV